MLEICSIDCELATRRLVAIVKAPTHTREIHTVAGTYDDDTLGRCVCQYTVCDIGRKAAIDIARMGRNDGPRADSEGIGILKRPIQDSIELCYHRLYLPTLGRIESPRHTRRSFHLYLLLDIIAKPNLSSQGLACEKILKLFYLLY